MDTQLRWDRPSPGELDLDKQIQNANLRFKTEACGNQRERVTFHTVTFLREKAETKLACIISISAT